MGVEGGVATPDWSPELSQLALAQPYIATVGAASCARRPVPVNSWGSRGPGKGVPAEWLVVVPLIQVHVAGKASELRYR